jgi:hypothetical protein
MGVRETQLRIRKIEALTGCNHLVRRLRRAELGEERWTELREDLTWLRRQERLILRPGKPRVAKKRRPARLDSETMMSVEEVRRRADELYGSVLKS